ncbi:MAG: putative 2OG-Fe(II) oxygenase [Rhizomicrobium sp.]
MNGLIWSPSTCDDLVVPATAIAMLRRAIEADPHSAVPHEKLGSIYVDLHDFAKAAPCFAAAAALAPERARTRLRLAYALNVIDRPFEALAEASAVADADPVVAASAKTQAGIAFRGLARAEDSEAAFRAALALNPHDRAALFQLSRDLRRAARHADDLALCADVVARGARHAQVFLSWGRALIHNGQIERGRALLFDPARVTVTQLDMPLGFNAALADDLLRNPFAIGEFPDGEQANRGSQRIHHLMCGARPQLARAMLIAIRGAVDAFAATLEPLGGFDPWAESKPSAAHLHPWGLVQRNEAFEEWHTHRGGWLSGVYYVKIPERLPPDRGCIEFGPPPSLARGAGNVIQTRRYPPREGMLILAPSHYHHRTIPSGLNEYRISLAFDVVPDETR